MGGRGHKAAALKRGIEVWEYPAAVHRTILVVDIEGFGRAFRTREDQLIIRRGLYSVLQEALERSGVPWVRCHVEDRGDGVLVLIPPDVPKSRLSAVFPIKLAAGLVSHNSANRPEARIRLRVALHAGEVVHDDEGVVGAAVVLAFRLLDTSALRNELAASSCLVALMVSDWFFEEVVRHDGRSRPVSYLRVSEWTKEGLISAWTCHPAPGIFTQVNSLAHQPELTTTDRAGVFVQEQLRASGIAAGPVASSGNPLLGK
ncbi:hypothetical protein ACWGE0_31540 [Lentzea sp. NPDC054927]